MQPQTVHDIRINTVSEDQKVVTTKLICTNPRPVESTEIPDGHDIPRKIYEKVSKSALLMTTM